MKVQIKDNDGNVIFEKEINENTVYEVKVSEQASLVAAKKEQTNNIGAYH